MTKPRKPSPVQLKALNNLAAGRRIMDGMPGGRSFSGGFSATLITLRQRGWTDQTGAITDAGRAIVEQHA